MTYEQFLKTLMNYRQFSENTHELYQVGVDLHEGKYAIIEYVDSLLYTAIESHYGEEGLGWVTWFIFESNWGEKDWSTCDAYNDKGEIVARKGEPRHGAYDENGDPICYSFESLYEYLEKLKNGIQK
jgi:hypothetical protein